MTPQESRRLETLRRKADEARARERAAFSDTARSLHEAMGRLSSSVGYRAAQIDRTRRAAGRRGGAGDYQLDRITLDRLREQAQELHRNNPLARAAIDEKVDLVVGEGLKPRPAAADAAWCRLAEQAWRAWAEEPGRCDHNAALTFGAIQRMTYRGVLVDGDLGHVKLADGCLQPVEGEQLMNPGGAGDGVPDAQGRTFQQGVEMRGGRIVAYHVAEWMAGGSGVETRTRRVPAENFLHVVRPDRFSQRRGAPELAASIRTAEQVDTFVEATTISAMVSAMVAFVWQTEAPGTAQRLFGSGTESIAGPGGTQRQQNLGEIEPGQMLFTRQGESLDTLQSDKPGPQFEPFVKALGRYFCAPTGVPIELVLKDFTGGNFAMAKALIMLVSRRMRSERRDFQAQFLTPVYRWVIARAIASGELPFTPDWEAVGWSEPALPWFDPLKEATANEVAMRSRQKSLSQVVNETGRDLEAHLEQIAAEEALMRRLGITPMPLPGQQPAQAPDDDERDDPDPDTDDQTDPDIDPGTEPDPGGV